MGTFSHKNICNNIIYSGKNENIFHAKHQESKWIHYWYIGPVDFVWGITESSSWVGDMSMV